MTEVVGDLWTFPANIRVITTNGTVTKSGLAVMGRGCALEATHKFPGLRTSLGWKLKTSGNHVHVLRVGEFENPSEVLVSFPVKHEWFQPADLELIRKSALELRSVVSNYKHTVRVVLPRPGCGNGKLRWEDVKPVLEPILDERFFVITDKP